MTRCDLTEAPQPFPEFARIGNSPIMQSEVFTVQSDAMTVVNLSNEPSNCSGGYSATVGDPQWACHAQLTLSSDVARTVWCGYPHQKKISLSQLKNLFLDRENKLFSIKT